MFATKDFFVIAMSASVAFALPVPREDREDYKLLPEEVKTFYESLTSEDVKFLRGIEVHLEEKTLGETILAIKEKNPELAEKIVAMITGLKTRIDRLSEEPRLFMHELVHAFVPANKITSFREYFQGFVKVIADAKNLSGPAEEEILAAFPILKKLINN